MNLGTLLLYLVGNRRAILDVAHCRGGLWLGLIFVLSAGFAREYDGEDLWHEPWHLLIPLAASLGSSLALFLLIHLVSLARGPRTWPSLSTYRAILQLFWMTAPLAWLYAIPFERFLSPTDATRANLYLLGGVALWRVLLMSRAVAVLFQVRFWAALAVVMLFADTILLVLLLMTPLPVVNIMGGIRLTENEQFIRQVVANLSFVGALSWPIWALGAGLAAYCQGWNMVVRTAEQQGFVSWSTWLVGGAALASWAFVLPLTQPEQLNRWRVETALRGGRIEEGLAYMSQRRREDFPPHWDPPPRVGYGQSVPSLIDVRRHASDEKVAPWVRHIYIDKLAFQAGHYSLVEFDFISFGRMNDDELRWVLKVLSSIPEGPRIANERRGFAESELSDHNPDKKVAIERRALLEEFLRLADRANEAWDESRFFEERDQH